MTRVRDDRRPSTRTGRAAAFVDDRVNVAGPMRKYLNKVFPDQTLMQEVDKIARRMVRSPALTLRMTKRAIYQGMRNDLRTNLDLISSHYAVITASQEHKDLVNKFIAERGKKKG